MKQSTPLARKKSLIIKELPNETLVYDMELDKAHCLNSTAALVWKNCDGKRTIAQLRELLEEQLGSPVPMEIVWLALDQLENFQLLDDAVLKHFHLAGMSRRSLVKRVGFAALALPVIFSIMTPPAQAQGSLLSPGTCCQNPNECQSSSCVQSPACVGLPSTKAC